MTSVIFTSARSRKIVSVTFGSSSLLYNTVLHLVHHRCYTTQCYIWFIIVVIQHSVTFGSSSVSKNMIANVALGSSSVPKTWPVLHLDHPQCQKSHVKCYFLIIVSAKRSHGLCYIWIVVSVKKSHDQCHIWIVISVKKAIASATFGSSSVPALGRQFRSHLSYLAKLQLGKETRVPRNEEQLTQEF
jgi:hypothetical protein